ncbi:MAG: hypothetical protein WCW02_02025 [Candidatus Buchananbacteria bacterium]
MPQSCQRLTLELESLKQLKQTFNQELAGLPQTGKSDDLIFIREAKTKLEQTLQELQDQLWLNTPELTPENLKAQYEAQVDILRKNNLLKTLSTGKLGIEAIDKQEYPIPTLEQIEEIMLEKRKFFETKIKQGFVKLILVPFGLPIGSLIEAYDRALIEHHQRGELRDTQNQPLGLNKEIGTKFIFDDAGLVEAEATGDLAYFPQEYSKTDHQGKTKQELLPTQAWQVLLLEDLPDLPPEGQGKIIAHRQQPEANQSPNNYLKQLQTDPQYKGEQGLTPESWLIYALSHLTQTNQVIDGYQGSSKACYLLSSCLKKLGCVPYVYFYRNFAQVDLIQGAPGNPNSSKAGRFLVSIL